MALKKEIRQDNGIVLSYHRILFIQSTINSHVSIVVASYVDEESRKTESGSVRPYMQTVTYETDYIENMTVSEAYEFLKTLPTFDNAEDVVDDLEKTVN